MKVDLVRLHSKHPWPATRPHPTQEIIRDDGGGRELICDEIARRPGCVVIEVGSFLGDSALRWLSASADAIVICIDPWNGDWWVNYARERGNAELARRLAQTDGPIRCFFSNLWPYRDRVVAVRGTAPDAIRALHADGIVADIVYFDADKNDSGISESVALFPNAIICGDDWSWGAKPYRYPIRGHVHRAAKQTGRRIAVRRATWILQDQPLSPRQYLDKGLVLAADAIRPVRRRLRALRSGG